MNGPTNGAHNSEDAVPLPSAKPFDVSPKVVVQPPLTRRGHGPGLVLIVPSELDLKGSLKTLDPPPLQKWAEESFVVAQITLTDGEGSEFEAQLQDALTSLSDLKECDSIDSVGLICMYKPVGLLTIY